MRGRCTRLFEFKAGHNKLSGLPATFKLCYRLRVLDLAGNQIKSTSGIQVNNGLGSSVPHLWGSCQPSRGLAREGVRQQGEVRKGQKGRRGRERREVRGGGATRRGGNGGEEKGRRGGKLRGEGSIAEGKGRRGKDGLEMRVRKAKEGDRTGNGGFREGD